MRNQYDASASALGYIYQVRYALLSAIEKLQNVDDPDLFYISIEKLDDIAFEKDGTPTELLQAKYHGKSANLTDKSPDIWKTFRIWAEYYHQNKFNSAHTTLYLVTTEKTADESLASFLSSNREKRDINKAIARITEILQDTPSKENSLGFKAVKEIQNKLKLFLQRVEIIEQSYDLDSCLKNIKQRLSLSVARSNLDAYLDRVIGYWDRIVVDHLQSEDCCICIGELDSVLHEISEQFSQDNLPDDFSGYELDDTESNQKEKNFIKQIELFTPSTAIISTALKDYYKAYNQVYKWQSDGLLRPAEYDSYTQKLKEEWEAKWGFTELEYEPTNKDEQKEFAKSLYKSCLNEGLLPIRKKFNESFLARGSYHRMADKLDIGWHPEFKSLLRKGKKYNEDIS